MAGELSDAWKEVLKPQFEKEYMVNLRTFLLSEKESGKTVYPSGSLIFNAFNHTPLEKVKVVILGQDPYHGKDQAHGLSFSVSKGVKIPPSLQNIYKELAEDISGYKYPQHGNLTKWADQGVLLLNSTLTVRAGEPGSHQKKGWEQFTDEAIRQLSLQRTGIVFLLWGNFAQSKATLIDHKKHQLLTAAHPSPFSAYKGFMGCKHFSKVNRFLIESGIKPIDWQIT